LNIPFGISRSHLRFAQSKKAEIAHENAKSTEEKNEEVAEDSLQILSPELGIAIRIGGINIHMSFLHSKKP